MKEAKLVSLILPTYNRASILERCVNSVLAQSYIKWELIIVDDASTDDTAAVATRLAQHPKIRFCRNPVRLGPHANINRMVSIAAGRLVLILEDDLILEPFCVEKLVEAYEELQMKGAKVGAIAPRSVVERTKTGKFFEDIFYYLGDAKRKKMHDSPCCLNMMTGTIYANYGVDLDTVREVPVIHPNSLFAKRVFLQVGGYDAGLFRDSWCCDDSLPFKIRDRGYELYFQPQAVAHHKLIASGGRHQVSTLSWIFFYLRNNIIFRVKFFHCRSAFMVPLFVLSVAAGVIRYVPVWLGEKISGGRRMLPE